MTFTIRNEIIKILNIKKEKDYILVEPLNNLITVTIYVLQKVVHFILTYKTNQNVNDMYVHRLRPLSDEEIAIQNHALYDQ